LKAAKEDISAPGPSNVVINEKTYMPAVNKDASVQAVLLAPTPSTSCTSAPIKASKKYQDKVAKSEALKKEKEKNKMTGNEQKQVRCPSCGGTDHSRSSSKLCPMNKSKTKLPKPKDTVEKTFIIKTSLANTCKYPKFVTLIQEVVDHITQLVYTGSVFANYYFLELLKNGEELPVVTQNLFYNIFSIFAGQGKHAFDSIQKSFKTLCESTSLTQSDLDKYASKIYMTITSSIAKQYETLVRNYVCSTYEDRTLRHIFNVLSEKTSPYFCGDNLTVEQRKSLAKHIFQQKINLKSA
jgi:ribosomal protein L37AE/L43A